MKRIINVINCGLLLLVFVVFVTGCSENSGPSQTSLDPDSTTLNVIPSPNCGVTLSTDPACGALVNRTESTLRIAVDGSNGFEVEVPPRTAVITKISTESSHDFRVDVIDPADQAERTFRYFLFVDNVAADQIVDLGIGEDNDVFVGWFFEVNDIDGRFSRMGG